MQLGGRVGSSQHVLTSRKALDVSKVVHKTRAQACAAQATEPSTPSQASTEAHAPTRKLILLRHAESETRSNVRDHERPISAVGKQQAVGIAKELQQAGWEPDIVVASNSKRTKQTLDEMATVLTSLQDVDAHFMGSLYTVAALDGQTRQHIQDCVKEVVQDQKHFCVMLVGHNKGWEEAASSLAGQAVKLQTASAALLQVASDSSTTWADVLHGDMSWQLVKVIRPSS